MPATNVGSIWSVPRLEDAPVVILSGPFTAGQGSREYLVAPLYAQNHPGFEWTSDDVRVAPDESGMDEVQYAALWNSRPVLEADLGIELGNLPNDVLELLKDFYWASINDGKVGKHERLGKEVRSPTEPAARFQANELERWELLSGRVFMEAISAGTVFVRYGDAWTLSTHSIEQLLREIEDSESLLGHLELDAVGHESVKMTTRLVVSYSGLQLPDVTLFDQVLREVPQQAAGWTIRTTVDPKTPMNPEPLATELGEAA